MKLVLVILSISVVSEGTISINATYQKGLRQTYDVADHKQRFPICGNCENIKNVHINTGFTCHFEDERQVENKFGQTDDEYAHCVPKDYIIHGEVENYCCFWSPTSGCSALIGRNLFDKSSDYCDTCRGSCSKWKHSDDEKSGVNNEIPEYGYILALLFCELWIW
ncbi:uncharacterized protein Dere_GG13357 [Drosophila erecta]|uniref:Uncharacterized protein n=2 Tax=Drosophila erecta TaxID=7220 RepID=B3NE13_DROER|nr:uncharacterized protein Dere_GG13357 [Drosophila erecta]